MAPRIAQKTTNGVGYKLVVMLREVSAGNLLYRISRQYNVLEYAIKNYSTYSSDDAPKSFPISPKGILSLGASASGSNAT